MENNKRRWLYLAMGTIMLLFLGLLYAWSIFVSPFKQIYTTWSSSNLSMTFTISMVFFCTGSFISGKLSSKMKVNFLIVISAILLFVGFFGLSRLNPKEPDLSLKMLYIFYGVFCGTGVGMSYNAVIGSVNKWFPDRVGFSSGILLMGFGLGGMILGSVVNGLVNNTGLMQTFAILAIVNFIVLILGAVILKTPALNENIQDKKNISDEVTKVKKEYTSSEMVRTTAFWCFFLWSVAVSSSGLLVISSAAIIATTYGAPGVLGLMVSVFNGLGRVVFGALFDKIGYDKSMLVDNIALFIAGAFLVLGSINTNVVLIFVGLLLVGLCYGGSPPLTSSVIYSFYGAENFAVNFSIANFLLIPAAFIGPMTSSALLERSNGDYTSTFSMIIGFAIIALILKVLLNISSKKLKN